MNQLISQLGVMATLMPCHRKGGALFGAAGTGLLLGLMCSHDLLI